MATDSMVLRMCWCCFAYVSRHCCASFLECLSICAVYVGEDTADEPDFTYIPETHQIASSSSSANTLESSLLLLQEGLESGAAIAQFEVSVSSCHFPFLIKLFFRGSSHAPSCSFVLLCYSKSLHWSMLVPCCIT